MRELLAEEVIADEQVAALARAVKRGSYGLSDVPQLLLDIVRGNLWQERLVKLSQQVTRFDRFEDFVTAVFPEGLGADIETLRRLCAGHPEAASALTAVLAGEAIPLAAHGEIGRGRVRGDDVTSNSERGNSASYLLSRLARDRPDVLDGLKEGRYPSVHAAAKAAGLVPERLSVPCDMPGLAAALRRRFTAEELAELGELLTRGTR